MGHDSHLAKVAANGRLSIPARQRKLLGLADGGMVVMDIVGGELRVRAARDVVNALQEEVRRTLGSGGATVDEFVAERHAQAAREDAR